MEKLTPKQNEVIWSLQRGASLMTGWENTGAVIGFSRIVKIDDFKINNGTFFRLVEKGLITQYGGQRNHEYGLTRLGLEIKTRTPSKLKGLKEFENMPKKKLESNFNLYQKDADLISPDGKHVVRHEMAKNGPVLKYYLIKENQS